MDFFPSDRPFVPSEMPFSRHFAIVKVQLIAFETR